jgi:hypothetical protein
MAPPRIRSAVSPSARELSLPVIGERACSRCQCRICCTKMRRTALSGVFFGEQQPDLERYAEHPLAHGKVGEHPIGQMGRGATPHMRRALQEGLRIVVEATELGEHGFFVGA